MSRWKTRDREPAGYAVPHDKGWDCRWVPMDGPQHMALYAAGYAAVRQEKRRDGYWWVCVENPNVKGATA